MQIKHVNYCEKEKALCCHSKHASQEEQEWKGGFQDSCQDGIESQLDRRKKQSLMISNETRGHIFIKMFDRPEKLMNQKCIRAL